MWSDVILANHSAPMRQLLYLVSGIVITRYLVILTSREATGVLRILQYLFRYHLCPSRASEIYFRTIMKYQSSIQGFNRIHQAQLLHHQGQSTRYRLITSAPSSSWMTHQMKFPFIQMVGWRTCTPKGRTTRPMKVPSDSNTSNASGSLQLMVGIA